MKKLLSVICLLLFLCCERNKNPLQPVATERFDRAVHWTLTDTGWVTPDSSNFEKAVFRQLGYRLAGVVPDTSILTIVCETSNLGREPVLWLQFFGPNGRVIPHIIHKELWFGSKIYISQWESIPVGSEVWLTFWEYRRLF